MFILQPLEYTCKNNGCGFEGNVLHHAPHCTREVQDRPASCRLSQQCRARGCHVVKGPHPSTDAIFHNNHRVELRPRLTHYRYPGMWDFLQVPVVRAAMVEPDEGYFSAWPKDNIYAWRHMTAKTVRYHNQPSQTRKNLRTTLCTCVTWQWRL